MNPIPLQAVIVDDEQPAAKALSKLLNLYCPEVEVVGIAHDLTTAEAMLLQLQPQMLFLDIELGRDSGFDLLPLIQHLKPAIIFTTGHAKFAVDAFKQNATHYLLKPIEPQQLQIAVSRVHEATSLVSPETAKVVKPRLRINTEQGMHLIVPKDVILIRGSGNYTTFHLKGERSLLASKNLGYFSKLFPEQAFFRCHQSFLVQLSQIRRVLTVGGCRLVMSNGMEVPVALSRRQFLFEQLR